MDTPALRLKAAMAAAGFENPSDAARAWRYNKNTLISYSNGNRPVSRQGAAKLAELLGVTAGWILYGDEERQVTETVQVPLVSWVSAGNLKGQDGVTSADIERFVPVANLPKGDWMALSVDGDSMNRVAPPGSVIIVNRAEDALINDRFYVFALETGEATFKRYRRQPQPMLQPFSTNLDHLSIPILDDEFYVIGRVRRVITDL